MPYDVWWLSFVGLNHWGVCFNAPSLFLLIGLQTKKQRLENMYDLPKIIQSSSYYIQNCYLNSCLLLKCTFFLFAFNFLHLETYLIILSTLKATICYSIWRPFSCSSHIWKQPLATILSSVVRLLIQARKILLSCPFPAVVQRYTLGTISVLPIIFIFKKLE